MSIPGRSISGVLQHLGEGEALPEEALALVQAYHEAVVESLKLMGGEEEARAAELNEWLAEKLPALKAAVEA